MSERITPDVPTRRETKGSRIYITNRPPVTPSDLLGGAESFLAGELYKQVRAKQQDDSDAAIRGAFYSTLTEKSHKYDPNILRWQTLRQNAAGNSTGVRLTGMEGYYAGSGLSDIEIVEDIAQEGASILRAMPRGLRQDVFQTLSGGKPTFPAIFWLSAEFGAVLAKYRAKRTMNSEARRFRENLPDFPGNKIQYSDGTKLENYAVPILPDENILHACASKDICDPSHPYGFMYHIGRVGHPLYRTVLENLDPGEVSRLQYKPAPW